MPDIEGQSWNGIITESKRQKLKKMRIKTKETFMLKGQGLAN
jgi:hypothetical protein